MGTERERRYITKSDLDEAVDKVTERLESFIDAKFSSVNEGFKNLEKSIQENKTVIEYQASEIESLKQENINLKSNLEHLSKKIEEIEVAHVAPPDSNTTEKLKNLEERIEERTNRQLRQTLVIKGIRESKNESWDDTKSLLAKAISDNVGMPLKSAETMLNRVHRSKPSKNINKINQRDIYANLYSWQDCENLIRDFRHLNISKKTNIHVEYKYGPLTTFRRNEALKKGKNLNITTRSRVLSLRILRG